MAAKRHEISTEPPRLASTAIATLISSVVYAATQWSLFPLTARLLSASSLGLLAAAIAVTTPSFLFGLLSLRAVYVSDSKRVHRKESYLGLRLGGMSLAVMASLCGAWIVGRSIELLALAAALSAFRCAEAASDLLYAVWQTHERLTWVAAAVAARGVLVAVTFGLLLAEGQGLIAAVLGMALSAWLCFAVEMWVAKRAHTTPGSLRSATRAPTKSLLSHAAPLGLVVGLVALAPNVPRLAMFHLVSAEAAGRFVAIQQLVLATGVPLSAVGQAAAARLARNYLYRLDRFKALALRLAQLGGVTAILGSLATMAAGKALLATMFGPRFEDMNLWLVALCVAITPSYIAAGLGVALTAAGMFKEQIRIQAGSLGVLTVACLLTIPRWGVAGVTAGVGAGGCVGLALSVYYFNEACRRAATCAKQNAP